MSSTPPRQDSRSRRGWSQRVTRILLSSTRRALRDQKIQRNMSYYNATIEEGSYITGELPGLVVEPGANIGYVASEPTPDVFRGENAFALGVSKNNPTA